jgi:teichoic acid transport system ATP-binding protein
VLLGVGAALNPELSGRRNVYLGGTALGLRRREVDELLDSIVGFAGLREFIDMPIRAYSSGMQARLQFAIATSVRPDILLIDEALAVGDEGFQHRSRERVEELVASAGTVFLVSHSLQSVVEMCQRAVWLDAGQVRMDGPVEEVVKAYRADTKGDR